MPDPEHRDLIGAQLHPPKAVLFTGDPAAYVPPASGILVICNTAPNAGKIYRTTGTTAGALSLLATGQDGAAATITIGTVTTVDAGDPAAVTNIGTSSAAVLDFDIPEGPAGADGVSGVGLDYTYSSTTTSGPSSGQIRWNNADPASATQAFLHEGNGAFMTAFFVVGNSIQVTKKADTTVFATFEITSATDNGSDRTYGVTPAGNAGSFTNGDAVRVTVGIKGIDGDDGDPGADGKTILNGSGAPSSGLGVNGDFYIDTTADAIYGPKTAGVWGSPTSIVGPNGDPGAGINPTGEYNGATAYEVGDSVSYLGSSYVATAATTGNLPTNTSFWQLLAQKGTDGIDGDDGATGSVSAASALTLEEQGSITSTGANEIDIVNVGGVLQWRLESDGATNTFASTADVALRLPVTADISTISYGATVDLDMAALTGRYRTISLTGNITFTTSNRASGRQLVLRLLADASTRTLTFPAGWRFVGTKPANIAASKVGVLSLLFFGTADSDCVAAWGVES